MIPQKAQEQATRQLRKHAQALNHALLNLYAPKHFEPLLAYIRDHTFAHLQVYVLPTDVRTQDALLSLAREVTDAFFAAGRAHELGWLCRDFEDGNGVLEVTSRERAVRAALRKVIERLLALPALKQGSKKKLKKIQKKQKQKSLPRRASVSQLLSKREKPAVFGRVREWPDVHIRSKTAQDAEEIAQWDQSRAARTKKVIKDRAAELCAALRADKPANSKANGNTNTEVDAKGREKAPSEDQADEASRQDLIDNFKITYLARQESMFTAIQEENRRRQERDAEWAREVESRLAEEASQKEEERRELARSWQEEESDGGSELEEVDVDGHYGSEADGRSMMMGNEAEDGNGVSDGQEADDIRGLMAGVVKHRRVWMEAGTRKQTGLGRNKTSRQQSSLPYFCPICGKRLADTIALNDHCLEHLEE